ncbi:MAG: hypothetical protein AAGJ28_14145 [Pseudomonadota bacterium]
MRWMLAGCLTALMWVASLALGGEDFRSEELCRKLQRLVGAAGANFHAASHTTGRYILPGAASCDMSLAPGGARSHDCLWSFGYRDAKAAEAFDAMLASAGACFPGGAFVGDQSVNHPDFYDLQTLAVDGVEIKISLKDKAALQKTLVFLRVVGRPSR